MNKTILIVEDEQTFLDILTLRFEQEGFTVMSAHNGKEGLELALAHHPAIILLDIIMPLMDGVAMIDELRKDPWGKDAPVVLLSNLSDVEKTIDTASRHVTDYWVKSDTSLDDVVEKVKGKIIVAV